MALGLGRLPAKDPRNSAFALPRLAPQAGRKVWGFPGTVLNQGATGTCVAHAAAHFIHCSPRPHRAFLDAFQLYRETVLLDEYPGNDSEAYDPNNSHLQYGSSGTGGAKALHKRGLISGYLWADTLENAIQWILQRGPVMVGSNWYDGMFSPSPEGYVKISGSVAGGHEYLVRGVSTKRGVAWAVNSWGPTWSPRISGRSLPSGHFLIPFEVLERLFREGGDIVSPLEII